MSHTPTPIELTGKIVECIGKKGAYKVWVSGPRRAGYLRLGHAWKTKQGATKALLEYMKTHGIRGYIGLARNENDSEID